MLVEHLKRLLKVSGEFSSLVGEFFLIGELANFLDLDPMTIRFYEREGLLAPQRNGKFRVYLKRDVDRLAAILVLRRFNMSVSNIKKILQADDARAHGTADKNTGVALLEEQLASLLSKQDEMSASIKSLRGLLTNLASSSLPPQRVLPPAATAVPD
jgi:DNA-binding transcriptional MerR regulator